jgi:hypothetical protein
VKIVGCLSWYDESPAWLGGAVTSAARVCDHVVAVDGAYALFPHGRAQSSSQQHEAIREAAHGAGIGLTLHLPLERWEGNEVEKRSFLLELGCRVAGDDGWLFVFDADDLIRETPADLRDRLAATEMAVAEVRSIELRDPQQWPEMTRACDVPMEWGGPRRLLFRALPGLRVAGTHWMNIADDGNGGYRCLSGPRQFDPEDALPLPEVVVEHRTHFRDKHRQALAKGYYAVRDALAIESCERVYVMGLDGEPVLVR